MAGDWLKMEAATPDKPEVLAIAARMGWDDPDLAVGKLFRVWRWFDQHTTNGNAPGVTCALLDRIAGVSGFALAMQSVGWLRVDDAGLTLPNFEKHCGKTAKERAQTARRVASHKEKHTGNATANALTVSSALPREEKRREEERREESKASAPPVPAAPARSPKRASALPDDFEPNETAHSLAASLALDMTAELAKFRDYYAMTGKTGKDWQAGFRNWLTKAAEFRGSRPQARASPAVPGTENMSAAGLQTAAALQRFLAKKDGTNG